MSDQSGIEWTDATWNPVAGCTRVNRDCDHCYAVTMTHRLEAMGQEKYAGLTVLNPKGDRHFNGTVRTDPEALTKPLSWRKPRRIFVNSMSDLFHKGVPFEFIDQVFAVMALTPQHTYQVLTKRPERAAEYFAHLQAAADSHAPRTVFGSFTPAQVLNLRWMHRNRFGPAFPDHPWPLPNLWLGTSCGHQEAADAMIPHLLACPAAVRFLSCEPLTGPVDLRRVGKTLRGDDYDALCGWRGTYQYKARDASECSIGVSWRSGQSKVDWVIVGGESGPGARPCNVQWIRDIVKQCQAAGVPVFVKQLGKHPYWDGCGLVAYNPPCSTHREIYDGREYSELDTIDPKGGDPAEWPTDLRVREFPKGLH